MGFFKVYNNEIVQSHIEITLNRKGSRKRSQEKSGMEEMEKLIAMSSEGFQR